MLLRSPDFSAKRAYVPDRSDEKTKTPSEFVVVLNVPEDCSSDTDAPLIGCPVESRTLPCMVALSDCRDGTACAIAARISTHTSPAITRSAPRKRPRFQV